jgi:hypothetical protein
MPLAKHKITGIIKDYPQNVIDHRILGASLGPYIEPIDDEVEEDKVVLGSNSSKRVYKKSDVSTEDAKPITDEESFVTDKAGDE